VTTQVYWLCDPWRAPRIVGSAVETMVPLTKLTKSTSNNPLSAFSVCRRVMPSATGAVGSAVGALMRGLQRSIGLGAHRRPREIRAPHKDPDQLPIAQVFSLRTFSRVTYPRPNGHPGRPARTQEGCDQAGVTRSGRTPRALARFRTADRRGDRGRGDGVPPHLLQLLQQQEGGAALRRTPPHAPPRGAGAQPPRRRTDLERPQPRGRTAHHRGRRTRSALAGPVAQTPRASAFRRSPTGGLRRHRAGPGHRNQRATADRRPVRAAGPGPRGDIPHDAAGSNSAMDGPARPAPARPHPRNPHVRRTQGG